MNTSRRVASQPYITELLCNGASLAETRELARHSDVRMTMKYTHIGIYDQAKAVAKLPAAESWLHYGCSSKHSNGHSMTSHDTAESEDDDVIPYSDSGCDTKTPVGI